MTLATFPLRVRCVKADGTVPPLELGAEYVASRSIAGFIRIRIDDGSERPYYDFRFKPVVRVKMGRG